MVTVSLVRLSHEHTVEFANSGAFAGIHENAALIGRTNVFGETNSCAVLISII